ncbi:hypothetical protein [Streptomyces sp. AF1A]|jgi:hypothetical protein|uniref:hypothetical protein n=1 Tax=Streptomyces sp. AF1A TaxID=3394350 RepID=UPI0039BD10F0
MSVPTDPASVGPAGAGPASDLAPENPEAPAAPARRRGRTALLIAGAAVLGLVAGTCAGYLVQADRKPTRLPSLSQPVVRQAKGYVQPLTAAQDHRVKTDGDLRKLLLKRPGGTRKTEYTDTWLDAADYADLFTKPVPAFGDQLENEFRRAAVTAWQTDSTYVEIRLVQYRQASKLAASEHVQNQQYWDDREPSTRSWTLPGTGDGMVYVHDRPDTKPGYVPVYSGEAIASRGDIVMEIDVSGTGPVSKEKVMDLAKKQVARL